MDKCFFIHRSSTKWHFGKCKLSISSAKPALMQTFPVTSEQHYILFYGIGYKFHIAIYHLI